MVSPLISLLLFPSSLFSTHRQSKLLKMFISSSHSSNNNQLPITLRIKYKGPHPAFLSNFISLLPPATLSPPICFTYAGFLAVPGTSHTQCLFWVFTFTISFPWSLPIDFHMTCTHSGLRGHLLRELFLTSLSKIALPTLPFTLFPSFDLSLF